MCGLFGSSSSFLSEAEIDDTMTLGYLSRFRGKDATGIALLNRDESKKKGAWAKWDLLKDTTPAGMFVDHPGTKKFLKEHKSPMILMGHTRAATGGSMTRLNAQPFVHGHIVGAHNGVMDAYKDKEAPVEERSDSNLFYEEMASVGLLEALKKGSKSYQFAYALSWINTKDKTLHFLRNKERPLWRMSNSNFSTVFWASDPSFLEFMNLRSSTTFVTPVPFAPDREYKLDLTTRKWTEEEVVIPKSYPVTTGFFRDYGSDWPESWRREVNRPSRKIVPRKAQNIQRKREGNHVIVLDVSKKSNVFNIKDDTVKTYTYFGYKGKKFSLSEIIPLINVGCYYCDFIAKPQDNVWWRTEKDYLCDKCHGSSVMKMLEGVAGYDQLFTRSTISVALKK